MKRSLAATVLFAFGVLASGPIPASAQPPTDDDRCDYAMRSAWGRYEYCVSRLRRGGDTLKCLDKYQTTALPKLQSITDTACAATERWVDNGDGTVTDNLTGLVWEIKTNADNVANMADPHDADNIYSLTDGDADQTDDDGTAFTNFLPALNAGAGFAGSNGWRLPTLAEIFTIYRLTDGECPAAPCSDPVFGAWKGMYWTTTISASLPHYGFLAETEPTSYSMLPRTEEISARAVRGGWH